jgi:hypothetical protein
MSTRVHPQARTTPKIRQEIRDPGLSDREAAKVFNISRAAAAKWLKRDDVRDRSHRAHTLHTTLSATQRAPGHFITGIKGFLQGLKVVKNITKDAKGSENLALKKATL